MADGTPTGVRAPAARGAGDGRPPLLFVNQHYHPDVAATGQHLTDLCEHLAGRGWRVDVLASRGHYVAGAVPAPPREARNGVRITRVRATSFGRGSHLGRIVDYATFYARVALRLLAVPRDTHVVFLTTPPLIAVLGWLARRLRGQRYAIWSMDLHPEAEIAAGMLPERGLLARALTWLNGLGYRGADFVVDLGAYMKQRVIAGGVDLARAVTVPVWGREEETEPVERGRNPLAGELGLGDDFVVMYSGNAGLVHDFRDILHAMRLLKDDRGLQFLFVGGGPQRRYIERYAAEHSVGNFRYLDYFPRERLRYSLSLADAHLISLRAPFVGISVPAKLYGVMSAARPALFVGPERCETADTIREGDCGAVIDPAAGDAAPAIVATLRGWRADAAARRAMGERGRALFLERYERAPNCAAFEDVLRARWSAAAVDRLVQPEASQHDDPRPPAMTSTR